MMFGIVHEWMNLAGRVLRSQGGRRCGWAQAVAGIAADWVQAGLLTATEQQKIVAAASAAHLGS
jgi:hypothetical protein